MARGLWKGAISFGLVNVPVELFPADKRSSELPPRQRRGGQDGRHPGFRRPEGDPAVIRTRQYLAAVIPHGDVLLMDTLRYADEIRDVEELGIPSSALREVAARRATRRAA
jgi:non-homologous end joining protein Ku